VKRGPDRASAIGRSKCRGGAPKGERAAFSARRIRRCGQFICAFRRSASPYFLEANTSCRSLPKLGCGCIAGTRSLSSPLAGEDRSRAARSGEGPGIPASRKALTRRAASRHATLSRKGRGWQRASREQKMRKERCRHDTARNRLNVRSRRNV
jgi:hypothetical protein